MKCITVDGKPVVVVEDGDNIFAGRKLVSHDARLRFVRFAQDSNAIGSYTPDSRFYYMVPGMTVPQPVTPRELVRQLVP